MTNIKEIWADVIGYQGKYQVSNLGRIRSLPHRVNVQHGTRISPGRILRPHSNKRGYQYVMFGDRSKEGVHRIVCRAFRTNWFDKPCVNHIDGNPSNNHIDNLEWCTYSENEQHSFRVLGKKAYAHWTGKKGDKNPSSKCVSMYDLRGSFIKCFPSVNEAAAELDLSQGLISSVARGENPSSCGYVFRYISKATYKRLSAIPEKSYELKNRFAKGVFMISPDGDVLKKFRNAAEAKRETGIYHIDSVCSGRRPKAGGYLWKWAS